MILDTINDYRFAILFTQHRRKVRIHVSSELLIAKKWESAFS
jgi:hypothetical protein